MASSISVLLLLLPWLLIMGYCKAHALKNVSSEPPRLNEIDKCWRGNPHWESNRKKLADCSKGYGADAHGGKDGPIYMVTDRSDDPTNPKNGTLRYGVVQDGPLWIIFKPDTFLIELKSELLVSSYKTLDARGASLKIGNGPCLRIENASHVIIHSIMFELCSPNRVTPSGLVRASSDPMVKLGQFDGDGLRLAAASHVWIDHCHFDKCADHCIELSHASTMVTISNNVFKNTNKVMKFGHSDKYYEDRNTYVTVVYNVFDDKLVQRIPRARFGYVHLANNAYNKWLVYAIGGSANSTILSDCNHYTAHDSVNAKEIIRREPKYPKSKWKNWSWTTNYDLFLNGAIFLASGKPWLPSYSLSQRFIVAAAQEVPGLVQRTGPVPCVPNWPC